MGSEATTAAVKPDYEVEFERHVAEVAAEAQEAFWAVVAQRHEGFSGDFPPDATVLFDTACEKAVDVWLQENADAAFWKQFGANGFPNADDLPIDESCPSEDHKTELYSE